LSKDASIKQRDVEVAKPPRGWALSVIVAIAVVGISIALSASINPLFGRYVHWDWMAVLAPTVFVLFTLGLRRRWI